MEVVVAAAISFLLGVFLTLAIVRKTSRGTLKVYTPDDLGESPYLYVELNRPIDSICKERLVMFKVDVREVRSHK